MRRTTLTIRALALCVTPTILLLAACSDDEVEIGRVSFTQPADDTAVAGGLHLEISAEGVIIEEAGEVHDNAGHFHVIADDGCVA